MTRSHRSKAQTASRTRVPSRRTFRPRLEELEPRVVLSGSIPLNPTSWVDIGPAPIRFGQVPGGGNGAAVSGRVTGLATDPTNAAIIYAATAGGGVWKTTTGGTSWFPTMDNLTTTDRSVIGFPQPMRAPMFMGAVAVAPSNPQVVYAGSGEANNSGDSYYGLGVWVSTNGAGTWNLSGPDRNALQGSAIAQIAVDPRDSNTAWAAVSNTAVNGTAPPNGTGIYRTTDGGVIWTNVTSTSLPGTTAAAWSAVVIDPTTTGNTAVLFAAAAGNGVYTSIDGGTNWALVGGNMPSGNTLGSIALAIARPAAANPATLYASIATTSSNPTLRNLEQSTDGGANWTDIQGNLKGDSYLTGQGNYDNVIAIDPTNPNEVFAAGVLVNQGSLPNTNPATFNGGGIEESQDGGTTWREVNFGTNLNPGNGPHTDYHALAFDASPIPRLVVGNDGGVWRLDSNDFMTPNIAWTDLNSNLEITQFTGIALDPANSNIVYGGSQDNGTERFADDRQWTQVRGGDGGFARVDPNNHIYITGSNVNPPVIQRSDDGGNTFLNISGGLNLAGSNFYPPYVIDPNNSDRLVLGTTQLYFTPDRGSSAANLNGDWTTLGTAPPSLGAAIISIAIAPSDSNTIYVGTAAVGNTPPGLFVTTDNAQTWTPISPTFPNGLASSGPFPGIVVDPNDPRTAYVVVGAFTTGGTGEVWQTTDRGTTWTDITGNLPTGPIRSITVFPPSSVVFVGTDVGVFATNQVLGANTQWISYSAGMPNAQVVDLETGFLFSNQPVLAAATHGRGAYEIQVPTITINSFTPPSGVQEGSRYTNLFLGTFTPSDLALGIPPLEAADFTATVTWGDGSPPETLTANNGGIVFDAGAGPFGIFRLVADHTFREEGSLPVSVEIHSNALPFITSRASGTALANDAPLTLTVLSPNIPEAQLSPSTIEVARFFDNNQFADINDFTAYVTYSGVQKMLNAANGGIVPGVLGGSTFSVLDNHFFDSNFLEEGTVPFSVTVVDSGGSSVSGAGTFHVQDAPLNFLAVNPPAGLTEGASTGRRALATFGDTADTGLGTDINDFVASVYWGDGTLDLLSAANGGIVSSGAFGGGLDVVAEHRYTEEGSGLPFTINVADVGGSRLSRTVPIDIADAPLVFDTFTPPAPPSEGFQSFGTLATFSDPGGNTSADEFTATVVWGDGTVSSLFGPAGGPGGAGQLGIVYQNGQFVVFSNHIWEETPRFGGTFTVQVTDVGGAAIAQSAPIVVADNPLTLVTPPAPVTVVEGQDTGKLTLLTFSDPGFPSYETPAGDYTAVVDWGDGTPVSNFGVSVGPDPLNNNRLAVFSSHIYTDEVSNGTLTVTVIDAGGAQVSAQATVNVAEAPLLLSNLTPPSGAVEGRNTGRLQLANVVDSNPFRVLSDYQAVVSWGDGTTDTLTAANGGIVSVIGNVTLFGAHTYDEELNNGTFSIIVTDGGASASQSRFVSVGDAALAVTLNPPTNPVAGVPTGLQTLATWTDADPKGTAGDYTVRVTWGDQTNSALTAANGGVVDDGDGTFSAVADHTYGRTGLLSFSVVIQDAGASSPPLGAGIFVTSPVPLLLPVTTLAANPNPSVVGQPVTFTAIVTPAASGQPMPAGTVTFKDGATVLATVTLGSVTTVSAAGTTTAASQADWWKGEGNVLDTRSGQNGTLQGGVTFAPGQVGQAFSFDGAANSFAQLGRPIFGLPPFGTADFAVAFWLQTAAAGPQTVLGDRVTAGGGNFYSVRMAADGHLVAELDQDAAGTNDVALTGNGVVNDGAFHHVALVRSGTTLSLYLDGALDSSASAAGVTNLTSSRSLMAGAEPEADLVPAFTGLLDEVQVYRRALTGQEVQATFTAGGAGLTSENAVLVISTIPAGMHSITATYNGGDGIFARSTSGPPVTWPVSRATTATALAVDPVRGDHGGSFTLTATIGVVAPGSGTPGGTVTFLDGTTILGSAPLIDGVATFTTDSPEGDDASFSAAYSGDHNFLPSLTGGYPFAPPENLDGMVPLVNLLTGQVLARVTPFPGYDGPVAHASADVNNDGLPDDVWAKGEGGRPEVKVTDGRTGQTLARFYAFAPSFHGGVSVAVADVNGDGVPDVIVGAGHGMKPEVKVIDGTKLNQVLSDGEIDPGALLADFLASAPGFTGGVSVAAADVNRDLRADVITAPGPGGGAEVKIISGRKLGDLLPDGEIAPAALLADFPAFDSSFHGGVTVAAGDVNGDGVPDVIAGEGPGGGLVRVFAGSTGQQVAGPLGSFAPFGPHFDDGVWVAARDLTGTGAANVIVGRDVEDGSRLKVYDSGANVLANFIVFNRDDTDEGHDTGTFNGDTRDGDNMDVAALDIVFGSFTADGHRRSSSG